MAGEVSVTGFFGPASKKPRVPDASSSTTDEMLLMSGGRQTPEDNLFSRPQTPMEGLEEPGVEVKEGSDEFRALAEIMEKVNLNSENSLKEMKTLQDSFKSLEVKLLNQMMLILLRKEYSH